MTTFARASDAVLPDLRFGFAPLPEPEPGFDPAGDARALVFAGTASPARYPVPGTQVRASLGPGQRFVLRLPAVWNGKLVVCGTPATRSEFASDAILGDFLLARGYAFAASNKGIPYNAIVTRASGASEPERTYRIPFASPGIAADEYLIRSGVLAPVVVGVGAWHTDFADLARTARDRVRAHYGRAARRTYAAGLSIGGGQVRYLLERHPELVDGGLEWAAVYWHPERNLLSYLPAFLAAMPAYVESGYRDAVAHAAIVAAGFPADRRGTKPGHASLWDDHYAKMFPHYADFTTFLFAQVLDPAGAPLASRAARASYVPSTAVRGAIAAFAQTGALARPLIGLAGDADVFVTPQNNAAPYLAAVRAAGCGDRYWQYIVAGGTHVDGYCSFGYDLQPQLPFVWRAFERLEELVEGGLRPPGAGTARVVRVPEEL
jgi:hypothetical protein